MQIPFFRNSPAWTHVFYVFSLIFLGGLLGEAFVYLIGKTFWGINYFTDQAQITSLTDPAMLNFNRMSIIIITIFMFITPATVFRYLMEYKDQDYLAIRKKPVTKPALIVTMFFILCFVVSNFLFYVNNLIDLNFIPEHTGEAIKQAEAASNQYTLALLYTNNFSIYLINLVGIALLPAIGEELIFRSIFQRLFIKIFRNVHVAVIFCGILFSLMHFNYYGFLSRAFMGIVLGYIYVSTGNIWYCIIFHFLNNALGVTAGYMIGSGLDVTAIDMFGAYGMGRWIGLGILILLTVFALTQIRKTIDKLFVEEIKEF